MIFGSGGNGEMHERLQKVMAHAGVASRRHSEELILAGRVKVNGQVVSTLGTRVDPSRDRVEVDEEPIGEHALPVYIVLNKPTGVVTTLHDPQGRRKVTDLLEDVRTRVYPVGRLDYDTEGLLLLTNDGELAHALMHPAHEVPKTYVARVKGIPDGSALKALATGVMLDDGPTAPARVRLLDVKPPNLAVVSISIREGRNRQVRRMFEAVGTPVISLRRTKLGPLELGRLPVGAYRPLTEQEVAALKNAAGLNRRVKAGQAAREETQKQRVPAVPAKARTGPGKPAKPDIGRVERGPGRK
jgi:pseudouridine synthase